MSGGGLGLWAAENPDLSEASAAEGRRHTRNKLARLIPDLGILLEAIRNLFIFFLPPFSCLSNGCQLFSSFTKIQSSWVSTLKTPWETWKSRSHSVIVACLTPSCSLRKDVILN